MTAESTERLIKADLTASLREIESFLRDALKDLHTKDGLLERDQFNLARIDSLLRILNAQVIDKEFGPTINNLLAGLMELEAEVKTEMGEKFGEKAEYSQENEAAIQMLLSDAQADMLKVANVEADSLSSYIRKAVLGNGKLDDLYTQIGKELDIRLNQAMVLATTTIYSFKQMVTLGLADQLQIEWFAFVGPDDKVTRDWCDHWVGRRGTIEMFEATADMWGRENQPNPVAYWRGGYNCRHELMPITPDEFDRFPEGPVA